MKSYSMVTQFGDCGGSTDSVPHGNQYGRQYTTASFAMEEVRLGGCRQIFARIPTS